MNEAQTVLKRLRWETDGFSGAKDEGGARLVLVPRTDWTLSYGVIRPSGEGVPLPRRTTAYSGDAAPATPWLDRGGATVTTRTAVPGDAHASDGCGCVFRRSLGKPSLSLSAQLAEPLHKPALDRRYRRILTTMPLRYPDARVARADQKIDVADFTTLATGTDAAFGRVVDVDAILLVYTAPGPRWCSRP